MKKMKIAILGEMPRKGYSGGRYCAWVMAEVLAHNGNDIYVITNFVPEFSKDFEDYFAHTRIQTLVIKDFYHIPFREKRLDYVICIPSINCGEGYYYACRFFALKKKAQFSFINFETPNWYKEFTEMNRPDRTYDILRKICRYGCLIISISKEGQRYAEKFYDAYPSSTEHCTWSPPINSIVADSVKEEKRNQVLIFLRTQDKHKGGDDFLELLGDYMRGMECVCIVGNGHLDSSFLEEAEKRAEQFGISLRFEKRINDYRKFQELKRSKLLLYPSYFEGYGYPPVESLYCGTPCIVYDLPVLREISGGALIYCEIGNIAMMRKKAEEVLNGSITEAICVDTAEFARQAEKLQKLLVNNLSNPKIMSNIRIVDRSKVAMNKNIYALLSLYERIHKWIWSKIPRVPDIIQYCVDHDITISEQLNTNDEQWKLVKRQLENKKIFIWGSGRAYYSIYPKYKERITPMGILDKDTEKIGTIDRIGKKLVIQSPEVIREMNPDDIAVLISNKEGVDEIIIQLKEMGIRNYHSLCMLELNTYSSKLYRIIKSLKKFFTRN